MRQDRIIDQKAYQLGLVHNVISIDELASVIEDVQRHISKCSIEGISLVKTMLNNVAHVSRNQA